MKRNLLLILLLFYGSCAPESNQSELKLNHIQLIGSHNSYKLAIEPELLEMIKAVNPEQASYLDYSHLPRWDQLDLGLRVLELDVYHDPEGGRFEKPLGLKMLSAEGLPTQPYDEEGKLSLPGFKVFHMQDLDFRSHYLLFADYLEELKNWSLLNPNHLPVFITINAKDANFPELGLTPALPFEKAAFDALDEAIINKLGESRILVPGDLIEGHDNLEEAVTNGAWPELTAVRGKFIFILDETGDKLQQYLLDDPQLESRVMFVNVMEGNPLAAIRIINDPVENQEYIQSLVKKGYIVRTRTDVETREARENDTTRMKMAFSSGAQLVSTDYYLPDLRWDSGYQVVFEDGAYKRINPVFDDGGINQEQLAEEDDQVIALNTSEFSLAKQKIDNMVLDVRTEEEVAGGIIPDAVHIDFMKSDFENRVSKLDRSLPVLVYCKVGARSAKASEKMKELGFKKVYHLEGGIDVWTEKGYPVIN